MAVDEQRSSDGATTLERALAVARQRRRVRLLVFVGAAAAVLGVAVAGVIALVA
jgi:hypothetical protein